ncbi:MAG: DUF2628 domain-containing protein [Rhodospirillaceae bacterium]|jgi:hypothetical protein
MRLYTIHVPAPTAGVTGPDRLGTIIEGAVPVKEGFCWPAFFFSIVWALWHRLWWVALALIIIIVALSGILTGLGADPVVQTVVSVAIAVAVGFLANDLRRRNLARRGLSERAVVAASNGEGAVERYFTGRAEAQRG